MLDELLYHMEAQPLENTSLDFPPGYEGVFLDPEWTGDSFFAWLHSEVRQLCYAGIFAT